MTNNSNIAAVIPAYQEEKHVGEVAKRARSQLEHVLMTGRVTGQRDARNRPASMSWFIRRTAAKVNRSKLDCVTGLIAELNTWSC